MVVVSRIFLVSFMRRLSKHMKRKPLHLSMLSTHWSDQGIHSMGGHPVSIWMCLCSPPDWIPTNAPANILQGFNTVQPSQPDPYLMGCACKHPSDKWHPYQHPLVWMWSCRTSLPMPHRILWIELQYSWPMVCNKLGRSVLSQFLNTSVEMLLLMRGTFPLNQFW